jgi:hypothetical protein
MSHALDVPCKLRWDVHELGQWNDATVLYPCDRVSTGTDSRAVTRMVPDDLGGGGGQGGMGTVKFEPDQTSSIPVNITLTMIELPRFDHIYFLLA